MSALVGRLQIAEASARDQAPKGEPGRSVEQGREKVLRLHGSAFLADPSGVLYWPDEHLMVVADLHLEKGSSYARRRVFLPPYDTAATLMRLAAVVARLQPRRVVALGDSFHDNAGPSRLSAQDAAMLRAMQVGRDWLWIAGNHDAAPECQGGQQGVRLDGEHADHHAIGHIRFRHEPSASPRGGEIAGHLHPVAIVGGRTGGSLRRRCFIADGARCIMPAFGAYAGGLNILDPAIAGLFAPAGHQAQPLAHVLGQDAVYSVARRQCLADARR